MENVLVGSGRINVLDVVHWFLEFKMRLWGSILNMKKDRFVHCMRRGISARIGTFPVLQVATIESGGFG